jgi:hypothetical protein
MGRMRLLGLLTMAVFVLAASAAQAGNEAAPWSAPDYLSPAGLVAEGPSLGMLADGSLAATWTQDTSRGWFPELVSEPFGGAWSTPDPISSTAISAPEDPIGGARTAWAANGQFVSTWLAPSAYQGFDVDGAYGSVTPGDSPSAAPYTYAANTASGGFVYGGITPQVVMSTDGTGTVEWEAASKTPSGGTYTGVTAIAGGVPGTAVLPGNASFEYNSGPYSGSDYSAEAPSLAVAPLNSDWDASMSDAEAFVSADSGYYSQVYTTDDPSDWSAVTPLDLNGQSGEPDMPASAATVAILANGNVLEASNDQGYLYIWETGDAAATTGPIVGSVAGHPAIATFNDGSATIAYLAEDSTTHYSVVDEVTVAANGTVSAPVTLSPNTLNAANVTDAYGPDGTTYVAWTATDPAGGSATDNGIYASVRLPGGSFPTTPQAVYTGSYVEPTDGGAPKIAVDQTGFATIIAEVTSPTDGNGQIAAFTHANPILPRLLTNPVITPAGTPSVGAALTCSKGMWANQPTTFTFQWLLAGKSIGGATTQTFTVPTADAGQSLSCQVTATNAYGSALGTSAAVTVSNVLPTPPSTGNTTTKQSAGNTNTQPSAGKTTTNNGHVSVTVSCPSTASSCSSVTASLSVVEELTGTKITGVIARAGKPKRRRRTVTIAKVTKTVKPGHRITIVLSPNARGRALIKKHHHIPAAVTILSGKTRIARSKVTLR